MGWDGREMMDPNSEGGAGIRMVAWWRGTVSEGAMEQ